MNVRTLFVAIKFLVAAILTVGCSKSSKTETNNHNEIKIIKEFIDNNNSIYISDHTSVLAMSVYPDNIKWYIIRSDTSLFLPSANATKMNADQFFNNTYDRSLVQFYAKNATKDSPCQYYSSGDGKLVISQIKLSDDEFVSELLLCD